MSGDGYVPCSPPRYWRIVVLIVDMSWFVMVGGAGIEPTNLFDVNEALYQLS